MAVLIKEGDRLLLVGIAYLVRRAEVSNGNDDIAEFRLEVDGQKLGGRWVCDRRVYRRIGS